MAFETLPGQKPHRTSAARQHGRRGAIVWVGSWRTSPAYRCGACSTASSAQAPANWRCCRFGARYLGADPPRAL